MLGGDCETNKLAALGFIALGPFILWSSLLRFLGGILKNIARLYS